MAVSLGTLRLWDSVLELTKKSQDKGSDPMIWAIHLSSQLNSAGVSLPSPDLANLLVSHICWDNNNPISWKFLEKALIFNIVPPLLVLALLSIRVIPMRHTQPAAFRLYMELLKRHTFKLRPQVEFKNYDVIMSSIDNVLNLSQIFGIKVNNAGNVLLEFIVSVVWQLVEAALEDEGLLELTKEQKHRWNVSQDMEIEGFDSYVGKRNEILQSKNTVMAVELIGLFLQNKITSRILLLARRNMSKLNPYI